MHTYAAFDRQTDSHSDYNVRLRGVQSSCNHQQSKHIIPFDLRLYQRFMVTNVKLEMQEYKIFVS